MTAAGWIFMIVSWTVIIGMFTFCMTRTLRPGSKPDQADNPKEDTEGVPPMSS